MYKNVNCCIHCLCVLCHFLQYSVDYFTNFITIRFVHSYSSICYSIDYLFKVSWWNYLFCAASEQVSNLFVLLYSFYSYLLLL